MKLVKSLTLSLLTLTFSIGGLNSQNHTIFLYGLIGGEYHKKDMQKLYKKIAQKITRANGTIEFWPRIKTIKSKLKKKIFKGFCNSREINRIHKFSVTDHYYRQLEKQVAKYYQETKKSINIVAIGSGIKILKKLLRTFSIFKNKYIGKAIIIENTNSLQSSRANAGKSTFEREIISAEFSDNGEIVLTELSNQISSSINTSETEEEESEYTFDSFYNEEEYEYYSDEDSEIESIASDLSESVTNQDNTDLSDKVVVIDAQEYLDLLKKQKTDHSCWNWFTAERIGALAKAGALAASIIIPLI